MAVKKKLEQGGSADASRTGSTVQASPKAAKAGGNRRLASASAKSVPAPAIDDVILVKPGRATTTFQNVQTGRSARVPNEHADEVRKVLEVAFSKPESEVDVRQVKTRGRRSPPSKDLEFLNKELLDAGSIKYGEIKLDPAMVLTHPAHPDVIVQDDEEGIATLAFRLMKGNKLLGHVLVHARDRYVLSAPMIQSMKSTHRNLNSVGLRLQALLERPAATAGLRSVG